MSIGNINRSDEHVLDLLSVYIDGVLDASELARVRAHIDTCQDCHAEYLELSATKQMLSSLPTIAPPRAFTLTQEMVAPRRSFWDRVLTPRLAPRLATGSVLAFVLLVMVLVGDSDLLSRKETATFALQSPSGPMMAPAAGGAARADATPTTAVVQHLAETNVEAQKSMPESTSAAMTASTPAPAAATGGESADATPMTSEPPPPVTEDTAAQGSTEAATQAGEHTDTLRILETRDVGTRQSAERSDGNSILRIVEAALALLALGLAVGAFLARRGA